VTEIEEEIAIATEKGIVTVIGVEEVLIEIHEVLATLISRTLEALVDVTGAAKKMEETIDMSAIGQLVAMIAGRNRETIAGKRLEMTEWEVAEDGTIEAAEVDEVKLTGLSPLPEMRDWSWSCLVLAILGSILANMRISRLRLLERTYHHTSHR